MALSQPNPNGFVFSASAKEKPPDGEGDKQMHDKQTKVSFRGKVMGQQNGPKPCQKVDLIGEKLARIEYKDNNPLLPMVVKLLGKSIGFFTMKERLHKIWKLSADFEIMDIGNGFYMMKFDHEVDRANVINEGPWMIFDHYDHYLTVQCWSQDFIAHTAKIDRTMVWIRFPGLNLYYYDESVLLALAAAVCKLIKVDSNTLDVRRGRFARVCVEIDLNKPVIGKVWLKDFWYKVEYEGLHRVYSNCGCYGHLTRDCKSSVITEEPKAATSPVVEVAAPAVVAAQAVSNLISQ